MQVFFHLELISRHLASAILRSTHHRNRGGSGFKAAQGKHACPGQKLSNDYPNCHHTGVTFANST